MGKRKEKGLRVLNFALLLVVFKRRGSEGVTKGIFTEISRKIIQKKRVLGGLSLRVAFHPGVPLVVSR